VAERIRCVVPEEIPSVLDSFSVPPATVSTVAGYRVNVEYEQLDKDEQRVRLDALRGVIGRSLKKLPSTGRSTS
jgi:hypothetical protein